MYSKSLLETSKETAPSKYVVIVTAQICATDQTPLTV